MKKAILIQILCFLGICMHAEETSVNVYDGQVPGKWNKICRPAEKEAEISISYNATEKAALFRLPAKDVDGDTVCVLTRFNAEELKNTNQVTLELTIKADQKGKIDITIPDKEWKTPLKKKIEFTESGKWQTVKLKIPEDFISKTASGSIPELRGELFIYRADAGKEASVLELAIRQIKFVKEVSK